MKKIFQTHPSRLLLSLLFAIIGGGINAWGETVTYTVTSTSAVTTSGTAPDGSSATYKTTYSAKEQLTAGNSMTLTLSGYTGYKVTGITLSMKSNSSKGAGSLSFVAGTTTLASISNSDFNTSNWYGNWSTSYVNVNPSMTNASYVIQDGEKIVITISATVNSLYCKSFTLTYEEGTPLTESDLALDPVALSFDLYNNSSSRAVSYTTSSTGAVTVSGGDGFVTTSVNESTKTITVTPKAVTTSPQTITVSQAADATYAKGSKTFTVTILDSTPAYTVTFSDGGNVTEPSAHAGVTLPTRLNRGDYTFIGWCVNEVASETTVAPETIITGSYHPTSNITLYPVYQRIEVGGEITNKTASVTMSEYATENSWGSSSSVSQKTVTIDSNVTATCNSGTNSGKYYTDWRIYQNETGKVTIATKIGELTSVTFTFSNSNGGTLVYGGSTITSGTPVEVSGTSADFIVGNSGSASNGQIRITAISVNYSAQSSTTYYCSSPVITEPTIIVTTLSIDAPATGKSDIIDVTYENITDVNAEVVFCDAEGSDASYDWIIASINGENNIEYIIDPNTDIESRMAYMRVYALDDETNDVYSDIIAITQVGRDYATLPFAFNNGKSAIESTTGLTQNGLGSDYSSVPKLKFDDTDDNLVLKIDDVAPGTLSFDIKGNSFSGSTFKVQVSVDGVIYKDLDVFVKLGETESKKYNDIDPDARYIRWYYTNKSGGNVALGNISLTAAGNTRPITVTSAGYATYCSNVALDFTDSDIKAYVGTRSGDNLSFTRISRVPARTGLLLVYNGGTEEDVPVLTTDPETVTNNCLTGVTEFKQLTVNDYILNVVEGEGAGFFKTGTLHTKLKANRAYIPASAGAGVKSFALDLEDNADGIEETLSDSLLKSENIYNLAGQRLSKMQKGINIVNGKKVLK